MTPLESLAKYLTETVSPVYVVLRSHGLPHFDYDHAHAVGEVVSWSTSKRAAKDKIGAQWAPELYSVVKMQRVQ